LTTVDAVAAELGVAPGALIKAMPVVTDGDELLLVLVRGDHRLNEIKLANHLGAPVRQARADEIEAQVGPAGFIGPVGAGVRTLMDEAIAGTGLVTGANEPDAHLIGVEPGRDFRYETCDVRTVEAGDLTAAGDPIEIEAAIEVGNIFKLGTRYAEPLGATYLDPDGVERPIVMGSYGIGPARIVAAAVEQRADELGICWPPAIAPWRLHVCSLGKQGDEVAAAADELYEACLAAGIETLLDDRPGAGPGEKLTDAELLGCPLRVTVGRRGIAEGVVEARVRASGEEERIPLAEAPSRVGEILEGIS
jgi:prolyl-tRNA synthetase